MNTTTPLLRAIALVAALFAITVCVAPLQAQVINIGTVIVDDDPNSGDIPISIPVGNWTSYSLTTDWSAIAGDPFSSEAIWAITDGPLADPGTTFYADPGPSPDSQASGASLTLNWNGFFDVPLDNPPLTDGFLLTLQTFAGSSAEWANTVLTLGTDEPPPTYDISSVQDYDGYIHLYEGSFDPNDPLTNLIAGNDDGAGGIGTSDIVDIALDPGTYVLVTSGFQLGDCGNYTNTISGLPVADPDMFVGNTCGGPLWDRPIGGGPSISTLGPVEYSADTFVIVPEPASGLLLLFGLVGVLKLRRS